ncbi:hypothetical protein WGH24286_02001 [Periweissella ghanensis]|uniref:Transposase n=2 Tax=Periweissella ghanensis TaxID=467997 RepID=A0ABN8BNR3_9LACO|nr:hypothetical protein WGH24286_00575 [Periweissella ghanensis]CAH0419519.1 hypothetical protein WGH24286_02001 [Periweissella ghanensis]
MTPKKIKAAMKAQKQEKSEVEKLKEEVLRLQVENEYLKKLKALVLSREKK